MLQVTRILGATAVSTAALASLAAAPPAVATPSSAHVPAAGHAAGDAIGTLMPPPARDDDRLTVTVEGAGQGVDGTYELRCRPSGGSHPDPDGACAAVDRSTRAGQDVFAPVPVGTVCTMQYGGPATARVTGTWAGRPVDATYDRRDGCEIARWDRLVPLLPDPRSASGAV
ncbi:SSI family serine proteinase inhibitor [Streptomyces sp. HMX87]|uniref:SSI family serine proteinase inhibitor n=1 Tax=Streptomyces sp. HMX87 TaxID=3390849 RepID=UPI003A897984